MTAEEALQIQNLEEEIAKLRGLKKTLRRNFQDMVGLLVITISQGNAFLGGHIRRVAELSKAFSEYMRFDKDTVFRIYYGGLLHDIGMVGMPAEIISSGETSLNEKSAALFRKHPLIGEKMISSAYDLKQTARIIRGHHEAFSGDGFPDGLAGSEIPIGARIVRLANDYDNYIYKYQIKASEASGLIKERSGYIYDPKLSEHFVKFIKTNVDKQDSESQKTTVMISELQPGMYISEDIILQNGLLLIPRGIILDDSMIEKIKSFESLIDMNRVISVVI